MNPAERQKLTEVLAGVHDFYGKDMSPFALQVWLKVCESSGVDAVTKALSAHLVDAERGQFMPKPADIVRQLEGTRTDRSLLAWGKVLDSMQRVGAYQSVCFDDPAIHAAIEDIGGWPAICRGELKDLPFVEKRFCDSYKAYSSRGKFEYPAQLAGIHAIENGLKGYASQPPVLIGEPEKAKEVMRLGSTKAKTQITHVLESNPVKRIEV